MKSESVLSVRVRALVVFLGFSSKALDNNVILPCNEVSNSSSLAYGQSVKSAKLISLRHITGSSVQGSKVMLTPKNVARP